MDEEFKKSLLISMQEERNLRNQVDGLNKEIQRKDNIILTLYTHIINTNDMEFIKSVNDDVKTVV